jgi:D-alanine-D-alanine ligase
VLPPAEIDFSAFAPGKPRIVGYRAKWAEDSDEYRQTPRRFDFPASDRTLLDRLSDLARACWNEFDLRGYARVDFRVDREGRPWILEINANPCLSPDAGFAAALQQAGIEYSAAIARIVGDAVR